MPEALHDFQVAIEEAHVNLELWLLYQTLIKERRHRRLNRSGNYVAAAMQAHLTTTFVALGRVFDNRSDSIGLNALRRELENEKPGFTRSLTSIRGRIREAQETWRTKIGVLRHEVYAHRTIERSVPESFERAAVTIADVIKFVGVCREIGQEIQMKYDGMAPVTISEVCRAELRTLLDAEE